MIKRRHFKSRAHHRKPLSGARIRNQVKAIVVQTASQKHNVQQKEQKERGPKTAKAKPDQLSEVERYGFLRMRTTHKVKPELKYQEKIPPTLNTITVSSHSKFKCLSRTPCSFKRRTKYTSQPLYQQLAPVFSAGKLPGIHIIAGISGSHGRYLKAFTHLLCLMVLFYRLERALGVVGLELIDVARLNGLLREKLLFGVLNHKQNCTWRTLELEQDWFYLH